MLFDVGIALAGLYVALAAAVYLMQSRLVYYPQIGRDVSTTPRAIGLEYEEVWLDAAAGERVHGWYVGRVEPKGVALIAHGNAGSIAARLEWLKMFHDIGFASLVFDYRGYGRSGGSPSEENTYEDARLAWAHLVQVRGWAPGDIVLVGESLGGPIAAHLAAREQPRALVLQSTFTSVPDLAAQIYRFLPVRWLSRFSYDTRRYLEDVKAPVLIAHSRGDEIVPYRHGEALFEAAREPKHFIELAGGHNDGFIFNRAEWVDALARFIERR